MNLTKQIVKKATNLAFPEHSAMSRIHERVSIVVLTGLLSIVVFDPSDSLTGLKRYFFIALLFCWLAERANFNHRFKIRSTAVYIVIFFGVVFPCISIGSYYLQVGNFVGYEGFSTFLGFLSLSLLIILSASKLPYLKVFRRILVFQAAVTVFLYSFLLLYPEVIEPLTIFGVDHGFLWIFPKEYGGFQYLQIFFKTAPLMVLPVAWYSEKFFSKAEQKPIIVLFKLIVCCSALLLSGTRANMIFAFSIPIYFAFKNTSQAKTGGVVLLVLLCFSLLLLLIFNLEVVSAMLDPNEYSNAIKIGYSNDYIEIFSNPVVLFFGQGIGAIHYFPSIGLDLKITEITLAELLRNFGLFIAPLYLGFWVMPLFLFRNLCIRNEFHWLWVGYASYLLISLSNYFILSSTGMVLLSVVYSVCISGQDGGILKKGVRPPRISNLKYKLP